MRTSLDATKYVQPVQLSVESAPRLVAAVAAAAAAKQPPAVATALEKARSLVAELTRRSGDRRESESAEGPDSRGADRRVDVSWAGLHGRVSCYAELPQDKYPKAARAQALLARIFGEGLAFLNLPYDQEWAHGQALLETMDREGLAKELEELAGPEFVAEVRDAQKAFGAVLKQLGQEKMKERVLVANLLKEIARAVSVYAVQVIGWAEAGGEAEQTAAAAALRPIDEFRAANARKPKKADVKPQPAPSPTPQS
jgi:hypothetical protein